MHVCNMHHSFTAIIRGRVCPILYTLNIVNNCKRRTFARVPKSLAHKILISYVYFNDSDIRLL